MNGADTFPLQPSPRNRPQGNAGDGALLHAYRAFGLNIFSEFELAELEDGDPGAIAQIVISRRVLRALPRLSAAGYQHLFGKRVQYLTWPTVGGFRVANGALIEAQILPATPPALIGLPLLGPVMATALHARRMLVLHASAVIVEGKAIVFLGDKGAGKSTTAAALVSAGYPLLTDDILPISICDDGRVLLHPGFPQIKLVDDAAERLDLSDGYVMAKPIAEFPKQQRRLSERFHRQAAPAHKIFVLRRGARFSIEQQSRGEALAALMRYAYMTLLRPQWNETERVQLLQRSAALANAAEVLTLNIPEDLGELGSLASRIAAEAG